MNIKTQLKERLLEIPINYRALREKHRLASELELDFKKVEFYLNELVNLGILVEKKQYICPNYGDTTTMNKEILNEVIDEGFLAVTIAMIL